MTMSKAIWAAITSMTFLVLVYLMSVDNMFDTILPPFFRNNSPGKKHCISDRNSFPTYVGFTGSGKIGTPAALRQKNPKSMISPFVTNYNIDGLRSGDSIEHYWGALSPYWVDEKEGFGVKESPLPEQCKVKQVQYLSRHGSRYPTAGSSLPKFAEQVKKNPSFKASGELSFLNDWSYKLGEAILVPTGKQQLFDSGVLAQMQYGSLFQRDHYEDESKHKMVVRTTSQTRMTESALAFLTGAFGTSEWKDYANLELVIEWPGYNNTLAPYMVCPNSNDPIKGRLGSKNRKIWEEIYLANITDHFSTLVSGMNWTVQDTAALQMLCPYETVAFGYSDFCELFNMGHWEGFAYAESLYFNQDCAFGAPTGKAQGIGWVNEMIRRIEKTPFDYATISSENSTLDDKEKFFPLDQDIYFDFTHDSVIASVIAALDFVQFSEYQPPTGPEIGKSYWSTSRLTPFAARLVVEVITCEGVDYIHFMLNQRTLPLPTRFGKGYTKGDGWAKLDIWLEAMADRDSDANWYEACYGDYSISEKYTTGHP